MELKKQDSKSRGYEEKDIFITMGDLGDSEIKKSLKSAMVYFTKEKIFLLESK